MRAANEDWENELWSYVCAGDGKNCPGFDSCQSLKGNLGCFNNETQRVKNRQIHIFVDKDEIDPVVASTYPHLSSCAQRNRITLLVRRLAQKYHRENWDGRLPVSENLITKCPDGVPIEIRYVPLKANHGAVWRMDDAWLIHLNSASSPARQRFTLYHEIFHILAHSNGTSIFKKPENDGLYFNEYLADHFSSAILTPRDIVPVKWSEIKDVEKMAQLFNVPASILYGKLHGMRLI
jgi:hypothetical protein